MRTFTHPQLAAMLVATFGIPVMLFYSYQLHEMDAGWLDTVAAVFAVLLLHIVVETIRQ